MSAWNLTAGFVLFVVILNNVQPLEAVSKGESFHGLQRKILPDFRALSKQELEENSRVQIGLDTCVGRWLAKIGEPCRSEGISMTSLDPLIVTYKDDNSVPAWRNLIQLGCRGELNCTAGKCECNGSSMDLSSCVDSSIPEQNLGQNCNKEIKAYVNFVRRIAGLPSNGNRVIDPGQNFQYITLMAVILFVLAAN